MAYLAFEGNALTDLVKKQRMPQGPPEAALQHCWRLAELLVTPPAAAGA